MAKERRKGTRCLNCEKELAPEDNYCSHCGQENHNRRVTVGMLIGDLFREFWTLDNKAIRSIVPLIAKPGFLSREYIDGKRVSYNRPLRIYLFFSFIFFLVAYSSIGLGSNRNNRGDDLPAQTDTSSIVLGNQGILDSPSMDSISSEGDESDYFKDRSAYLSSDEGQRRLGEEIQNTSPVFVFALVPLLGLIVFIFFYRDDRYYVDSFVFALHFQTVFFILLTLMILIQVFMPWAYYFSVVGIISAIYFVLAAKRMFEVSYLSAVLRFLGILITHAFGTLIFALAYLLFLMIFWV